MGNGDIDFMRNADGVAFDAMGDGLVVTSPFSDDAAEVENWEEKAEEVDAPGTSEEITGDKLAEYFMAEFLKGDGEGDGNDEPSLGRGVTLDKGSSYKASIFDPERFDQNSFEWGAIYWINQIRDAVEEFEDGYVVPDEQFLEMLRPLNKAARVYAEAQGKDKAWVKNTVLSVPKAFANAFDTLSDGEGVSKEHFLKVLTVEGVCALAEGDIDNVHELENYYYRKGKYSSKGGYEVGNFVIIIKDSPSEKYESERIRRIIAIYGDGDDDDPTLVFWNTSKSGIVERKASQCSKPFHKCDEAYDWWFVENGDGARKVKNNPKAEEDKERGDEIYKAILSSMGITEDAEPDMADADFWAKHDKARHGGHFDPETMTCKLREKYEQGEKIENLKDEMDDIEGEAPDVGASGNAGSGNVTPEEDAAYLEAVKRGDTNLCFSMLKDAFSKLFPDNKIVHSNGEPVLLFHGTTRDFKEFETDVGGDRSGVEGTGAYFTISPKIASYYAHQEGENGVVKRVFVNLTNPYMFNAQGQTYNNLDIPELKKPPEVTYKVTVPIRVEDVEDKDLTYKDQVSFTFASKEDANKFINEHADDSIRRIKITDPKSLMSEQDFKNIVTKLCDNHYVSEERKEKILQGKYNAGKPWISEKDILKEWFKDTENGRKFLFESPLYTSPIGKQIPLGLKTPREDVIESEGVSTDDLCVAVRNDGKNDGLVISNVIDVISEQAEDLQDEIELEKETSMYVDDYNRMEEGLKSTDIVVFNSDNVYSANAIEFDQEGDIIPLSKRFVKGNSKSQENNQQGGDLNSDPDYGIISDVLKAEKERQNGRPAQFHQRVPEEALRGGDEGTRILREASLVCRATEGTGSQGEGNSGGGDGRGEGASEGAVSGVEQAREASRRQEAILEKYAKKLGIWEDDAATALKERDDYDYIEGGETIAFFPDDANKPLTKVITSAYFPETVQLLDRIMLHNYLFPYSKLDVKGFGRARPDWLTDGDPMFCVKVEQQAVDTSCPAKPEQIEEYMKNLGFHKHKELAGGDVVWESNDGKYVVSDLTDENVFLTQDGHIAVIDANIQLNTPGSDGSGHYKMPAFRSAGQAEDTLNEVLAAVVEAVYGVGEDAGLDPSSPDFWMKHDRARHGGHFDPETMTCKLREKAAAYEEKKEQEDKVDDLISENYSSGVQDETRTKLNELVKILRRIGRDTNPEKDALLIASVPRQEQVIKAAKKVKNEEAASHVREVSASQFHKAISEAVSTRPVSDRWRVDIHPIGDYETYSCFVSDGGSVFALNGQDIVSVCKHRGDESISGKGLLSEAINKGGRKLDSYEGNHAFYAKCGFEPISWTKFNPEYAPEGAQPEDIIFYKYTGNKRFLDKEGVEKEIEDFKRSINPMEYDDAAAYRDTKIG